MIINEVRSEFPTNRQQLVYPHNFFEDGINNKNNEQVRCIVFFRLVAFTRYGNFFNPNTELKDMLTVFYIDFYYSLCYI